ncbi:MAG: hypothetical protein NT103_03050 [Campylobacterales bacterium]|nr:hypothetical protein [Campylobacterales bacterium]
MIQINPTPSTIVEEANNSAESTLSDETNESTNGWMNGLHLTKEKEYSYPINEVVIEMDTQSSVLKSHKYHLAVLLKDSYEFFCLKQELKNTNLSYLLNQEGSAMSVEIDSDDYNALANLLLKLKTYQISATLSPVKED